VGCSPKLISVKGYSCRILRFKLLGHVGHKRQIRCISRCDLSSDDIGINVQSRGVERRGLSELCGIEGKSRRIW
jgi:hypothetical protein